MRDSTHASDARAQRMLAGGGSRCSAPAQADAQRLEPRSCASSRRFASCTFSLRSPGRAEALEEEARAAGAAPHAAATQPPLPTTRRMVFGARSHRRGDAMSRRSMCKRVHAAHMLAHMHVGMRTVGACASWEESERMVPGGVRGRMLGICMISSDVLQKRNEIKKRVIYIKCS